MGIALLAKVGQSKQVGKLSDLPVSDEKCMQKWIGPSVPRATSLFGANRSPARALIKVARARTQLRAQHTAIIYQRERAFPKVREGAKRKREKEKKKKKKA